jgi:hypothetical protein
MKGAIILKGFMGMFFIISSPQWVLANEDKPLCNITFNHTAMNSIQSDTLPPPIKSTESAIDKPAADIIKEVPKARKQPVPIPVNLQIKPIKIIKPTIIKPLIKILH